MGVVKKLATGFVLLSLILFAPLEAAEFSFFDHGARAAGLGGAFAAKADDVFTLFDNPAGLSFLNGLRFKTGFLINNRTMTASAPDSGRSVRSAPFQFWGAAALSWQPRSWVTLGVGYFSPYSARIDWPWNWFGESVCLNMEFNAHYLRPAVAFRLPGNLAVGAGLDIVFSDLVWDHEMTLSVEKLPSMPLFLIDSLHTLSGRGLGFSAGILWKAHRLFQIGARYQHRVVIDHRGHNTFDSRTYNPPPIPHPLANTITYYEFFQFFFKRQDVTSRLVLPREVAGGVLLAPVPNLSLTFDAHWTEWRELGSWEFQSVNADEDLNPEFTPMFQEFYGLKPNYGRQGAGLVLKDAWKFKGGIEYRLYDRFAVRGGFARHESAVETRDLNPVSPDLDRTLVSLGFGYEGPFFSIWDREEMGQISVDMFFRYAWAKRATSSLPSFELTYEGNRWVFGVGVGFIF